MSNALKDLTFKNPRVKIIHRHLVDSIITRFLDVEHANEKLSSDLIKAHQNSDRISPESKKEVREAVKMQIGIYRTHLNKCQKDIHLYLEELNNINTEESINIFNAYSWYDIEFDKLHNKLKKTHESGAKI